MGRLGLKLLSPKSEISKYGLNVSTSYPFGKDTYNTAVIWQLELIFPNVPSKLRYVSTKKKSPRLTSCQDKSPKKMLPSIIVTV